MFEKSSEGTKPTCGVSIVFLVDSYRPRRWVGIVDDDDIKDNGKQAQICMVSN